MFGSFEDGSIVEWSFTNQGEILNQFIGHTKRVCNLFVEDNMLVSGSYDSTIRTWNISVINFEFRQGSPKQCSRRVAQSMQLDKGRTKRYMLLWVVVFSIISIPELTK